MVEGGGGAVFPVIFYDGEKEMPVGNVTVNPRLEYKPFQHMLSSMIGISPNQISTYIVDQTTYPNSTERRKLPITGKVNFGAVCTMKGIHFLAVLKRSRKSRNRRDRSVTNALEFGEYVPEKAAMNSMPGNMVLLRRNQPIAPFLDQLSQSELVDLNGRLQNSRFYMDNLQMAMARNGYPVYDPTRSVNLESFPPLGDTYSAERNAMMMKNEAVKAPPMCADCVREKLQPEIPSFHPCENDPVVRRINNQVAPIARPDNERFYY